jgi:catechol 2,3-dioxygenase-like lactoylglutathione lyase family enzyme
MSIPQRLSIVTLGVADIARSSEFYQRLGWKPAEASTPEIVWFSTGGSALGLFETVELAKDVGVPNTPLSGFRGTTLAINFESIAEVDAAWRDAVAAGADPVKQPQTAEWGGHSGYFADPDGHLWETVFAPGVKLDDEGRVLF